VAEEGLRIPLLVQARTREVVSEITPSDDDVTIHVTLYAVAAAPAWLFEEARQVIRHGWNEQAAIQEQVPHFAACFSNKEASMAGRAVGRSITASVIGFMIRANRIVGANP